MRISLSIVLIILIALCIITVGYAFSFPRKISPEHSASKSIVPLEFPSPSPTVISNSDGSYIEIVVGGGATVTVKDPSGNKVGNGSIEQASSPDGSIKGEVLYVYYVQQPTDGIYFLHADEIGNTGIQVLLYDRNGEVKVQDFLKRSRDKTADFDINFNKENSNLSNVIQIFP